MTTGTPRPDPCTLVFAVARSAGPDEVAAARAVEVWVGMAGKAGWRAELVDEHVGHPGAIAILDVEGVRYTLHLGPRKRVPFIDDSTGAPVERTVLKRSVWAEPVIAKGLLDAYP